MDGTSYYLEKLRKNKRTGFIFGRFPIPNGIPFIFTSATIIIATIIEAIFSTYFIIPFIALVTCWDHYLRISFRAFILEQCILEEIILQNDLIQNGIDPNFPEDPLYVTKEDRDSIFEECMYINPEKKNLVKLKKHYLFLISIVAMFGVIYSIVWYLMERFYC
jgi:hypothetical protein